MIVCRLGSAGGGDAGQLDVADDDVGRALQRRQHDREVDVDLVLSSIANAAAKLYAWKFDLSKTMPLLADLGRGQRPRGDLRDEQLLDDVDRRRSRACRAAAPRRC